MKQQLEPQNIDAERALLGAILLDPECLTDVTDICNAEDFFRPEHKDIFLAMTDLSSRSEMIDILTVSEELEGKGTTSSHWRMTCPWLQMP